MDCFPQVQVLCIELPGMGFSIPKGRFRFSLAEQALNVAAHRQTLGLVFGTECGDRAVRLCGSLPEAGRASAIGRYLA